MAAARDSLSRTMSARTTSPEGGSRPHPVTTADGHVLAADLFLPSSGAVTHAVLIAPAMAVSRRYYRAFAAYLAEGGAAVLVPDYRGVGGSGNARTPSTLVTWGEQDLRASAAALRALHPDAPLLYVGHSAGGQLFGLAEVETFAGVLLVASGSGYWGHYAGTARLAMWTLWHLAMPLAVWLWGYLPMQRFRQGEDVPKGVALQWARWGRHPRYVGAHADANGGLGYAGFTGPLRSYAIADDSYAPPRAVAALVALYPNAASEVCALEPAALGVTHLGHFAFFLRAFRDPLWIDARAWLQARAGLEPVADERSTAG